MQQLALPSSLSVPTSTDAANPGGLSDLRQVAWICAICQFWVAVLCLGGSQLLAESHDFSVFCGVVACIGCIIPIIYALYKKRFFVLFSCVSIFNLAPIWFLYLEVVLPGHDAYVYSRPMHKMEALFWAAAFQFFVNLIYVVLWRQLTAFSIRRFAFLAKINLSATFYGVAAILAFTVPLLAFYYYYESFDILWTALTAGRSTGGSGGGLLVQDSTGNSSSFMLPFNWLWQLTPLFGAITLTSAPNKLRPLPVLAMASGMVVIFVFFLGYYNWDKGIKFWTIAGLLLFFIIGVMEMQVRFRGNLLEVLADPEKAAHDRGLASATTFDPSESHRDNNMYLFCLMVQGYPDRYHYEGFNDFFAVLVNPIPRALWPGKPILNGATDLSHQFSFVLDGPLFMGTTSLTYSIVGEAYQAGGMWGIFVYAVAYALFMLGLDGMVYYAGQRQVLSVGVLGIGVFLSFWGYRAFFALIGFTYPLILLLLLLYLLKTLRIV